MLNGMVCWRIKKKKEFELSSQIEESIDWLFYEISEFKV